MDALLRTPLLRALPGAERLLPHLEPLTRGPGEVIVREGACDRDLYLLLEGHARILREGLDAGRLREGDHFGELALAMGQPRAASIVAEGPLSLARLSHERFEQLATEDPALALALLRRLLAGVGTRLTDMTRHVDVLLRERAVPRRTAVEVTVDGQVRQVPTGTTLVELLPERVDDEPVVAGLLDCRPTSLTAGVSSDAALVPVTTATWEGVRIYRQSLGLLLLEAAHRRFPGLGLRLEHSVGYGLHVGVHGSERPFAELAEILNAEMLALVDADRPLLEQWWTVEEAREHFARVGWDDAARLLLTWRQATCRMVAYGEVQALRFGPMVHRTALLTGFCVLPDEDGLLLVHGVIDPVPAPRRSLVLPPDEQETAGACQVAQRVGSVRHEHDRWLRALGVEDVGELGRACIDGDVSQLIRVAEGYQEKRIGRIADAIVARGRELKVVCIAGPSSSGKSTFIQRLRVQLQVEGLRPRGVSLDDYYVDRAALPRGPDGEMDLEAFEALRGDLLQEHLLRLLAGEEVTLARFDFATGRSHPQGGPTFALGEQDLLMLEGIHGLNPRLLEQLPGSRIFRVFVSPLAQLPFDRLTHMHASDLRLLRRIVRDRHGRNTDAASTIMRWPSVRLGERRHIFPYQHHAHEVFDSSLVYELCVLKVFAERYLLEVPTSHPAYATAFRLLGLLDRFVTIYPDHVPPTSILREFIGGSGFEY
ncbi:MAG: cyclic nucleotide-binding domain-containing protein [Myxococcales bacterium]|nr:cyclic nucleotide-binding domain-containing protein [Myxococcales bacterium]MCB9717615.1 cyclic nucleotide-binding domain-containing protein [Myxococcales bacterium]